MKLLVIFLAIVGLSLGAPSPQLTPRDLDSDFDDFIDLIPTTEIYIILFKFLDDTEVQHTITYMFGEEFKNIVAELDTIDEFNAVIDYLDDIGINARTFMENLKEILGIVKKIKKNQYADLGGMRGLIMEIINVIPWDEMKTLYDEKMETSEDFQQFVSDFKSDELKQLWQNMVDNERIQELSTMLTAGGVDIAGLIRLIKDLLNPTIELY